MFWEGDIEGSILIARFLFFFTHYYTNIFIFCEI